MTAFRLVVAANDGRSGKKRILETQHNFNDTLQRLIETLIVTLRNAKPYERRVFQRYVDTYSKFYGLIVISYYVSSMVVVFGSIFLPQPFPTVSEYPFRVDYEPVRTIIFVHQAFAGFQCAAAISLTMFTALLLLYAAARFEILMIDMQRATSVDALIVCMKKYHIVTRFAKDVVEGTRYIALFMVVYGSIVLVLCGLNIIGHQSFLVKLQFFFLAWISLIGVFMCVLPADKLINVINFHSPSVSVWTGYDQSGSTVRSVYESRWYDQVLGVQKTVLHILVPQIPVAISIKCIIPTFSLEYYCSYVSHAISLFTALRMAFGEDVDVLGSTSSNSTR
nr:uncharacterized protein LOC117227743 [Megalopta genalis]